MRKWRLSLFSSLFRSLSVLWIWIIFLQWIAFMEPIWYTETNSMVLISITAIAILEMILPFKYGYRLVIEAFLVLYIMHRELVNYWIYMPSGKLPERIIQFASSITPYLWFVLAAWVLFALTVKLINSQRRILLFTSANLIAFAVLDSFTMDVLWPEVAWVTFAMMGWLVSDHFRKFKERYPQGWQYLCDYPFKVIVNVTLIFTIVFVTGVSMPEVSPIITDPYTAWKSMSEGAVDGTTPSSTGLTGLAASGYSRRDTNLGGKFNFDYTTVMRIKSSERSYWRGESRSNYSGTGWTTPSLSDEDYMKVNINEKLPSKDKSGIATKTLKQTVTMDNTRTYPVLFGAYNITNVEEIDGADDTSSLLWKSSQSELHWKASSKEARYPKSYVVTSEVPIIPDNELKIKKYNDLYSKGIDEAYLQIPDQFPSRVVDLAKQVTATADTPYEKIGLLQNYLIANYPYTNEPDLSRKVSKDFVDSFLFEVKQGYCDYYSTTMVMMARSLKIPARWVKGYAPGQDRDAMNDWQARQGQGRSVGSGFYSVSNADAHSWAEIYYGPYGWIPVEATPGFDMPKLMQTSTNKNFALDAIPYNETVTSNDALKKGTKQTFLTRFVRILLPVVAGLVLLGIIFMILWRARLYIRFITIRLRTGKKLSSDEKVVVLTEQWLKQLQRKGYNRSANETLRESISRWEKGAPELTPTLRQLLELFEKAKYSPQSVSETEWRQVQALKHTLVMKLKKKEQNIA